MTEQPITLKDSTAKQIVDDFISSATGATRKRTAQFEKYERFISDNDQWDLSEQKLGDVPQLTFNQTEDYINTYLAKLFPRNTETGALEIGVKSKETDETKKEKYEKEIFATYEQNALPEILLEQGQNFLIGGDAALYYPRDPMTTKAKIISLDPTKCYLGWNGNKLEQFAFTDEISIAEARKNTHDSWLVRFIRDTLKIANEETERFRKTERITYWDEKYQIIKVGSQVTIRANADGFIPFSWIPNKPKPGSREGRSDGKSLYGLEKEYNFRTSDFAQRVKSNTQALLATYSELDGTKMDRDKISSGILPLNQGDKAEFLHLTENAEALDYIGLIERKMDKKMAINDAVNGEIKSNVSSLAMMYYFSPMLDRIALKRVYWDQAFRNLNQAILFYAFGAGQYSTEPIYQPVMMLDTETKIKNTILLLENRLISHKDAIDIIRGTENAVKKFEEIKKEFEELSKIDGFLDINKKPDEASIEI